MHKYVEAPSLTKGEDIVVLTNLHKSLNAVYASDGRVFFSMDQMSNTLLDMSEAVADPTMAAAFVEVARQVFEGAGDMRTREGL